MFSMPHSLTESFTYFIVYIMILIFSHYLLKPKKEQKFIDGFLGLLCITLGLVGSIMMGFITFMYIIKEVIIK